MGIGSVYEFTAQDGNGGYLDGGKTYMVTLPGPLQVWFDQTWKPGDFELVK